MGSGTDAEETLMAFAKAEAALGEVSPHTSFLFPVPSILYGFARVLDLGAQLDSYNVSPTPAQADSLSLANDWMAASTEVNRATIASLTEYLSKYLETEDGQAAIRKLMDEFRERRDDAMTTAR